MNYLTMGEDWFDLVDGTSDYIDRLKAECKNTLILLNTKINRLHAVDIEGETKYKLLQDDGHYVTDEDGETIIYDEVVLATPAFAMAEMLTDLKDKELRNMYNHLNAVGFYPTEIYFHQDEEYLSDDGVVVHARYDGKGKAAANTICKRWKFEDQDDTPVMKTWVLPGQPKPKNIRGEAHFLHPVMDKVYYKAQHTVHMTRGHGNVWPGGIIAGWDDSHESTVTMALRNGAAICAKYGCLNNNERLKMFKDVCKSEQIEKPKSKRCVVM